MNFKKPEFLFAALAVLTLGAHSYACADERVTLFSEAPKDVFTPKGFDDNDNVQVVLEGTLSNLCFHTAPTQVQVDQSTSRIYIDNMIYSMDQCKAGMMFVQYTRVVDIGILAVGNYEVWVSDDSGGYQKKADLPVVKSKPSQFTPDDELYAPVTEVSFQTGTNGGSPSVTIRGTLNNSCLTLSGVQVLYRGGNVVEVLPQANLAAGASCVSAALPFSRTVALPGFPAQGDVLIHVRSMGGQSVNRVVTDLDRLGL